MVTWVYYGEATQKKPPMDRALLAYVPDFNRTHYEVVTWNGRKFESELHGEDIHDYVEKWSLIFEAD